MGVYRPTNLGTVRFSFEVGKHLVQVSRLEGRWTATVDDKPLATWHMTEVEAWEAGVREADRIDRLNAP